MIQKARMLKAEKERAKRKAEADEKKAEEEKAKEKKKKKKKTKEDKEKGMEADAGETKLPGEGEDVNQEPQGNLFLLHLRACAVLCTSRELELTWKVLIADRPGET